MKLFRLLLLQTFFVILLQGCSSMYSTRIIDIEIVEPAKIQIPAEYKNVAIRYSNCNVAPNKYLAASQFDERYITHKTNIDSVASELHYQYFVEELHKHKFFDSIIEIKAKDYSNIQINNTIDYNRKVITDSIPADEINVYLFSNKVMEFPMDKEDARSIQYLHPKLGLYNYDELQTISDTTHADLLISLDYFSSIDGRLRDKSEHLVTICVISQAYWNFYDLNAQKYLSYYNHNDTVYWNTNYFEDGVRKKLPPQRDAVLNAADMSGTRFAQVLIPHWITVQRMYYSSGHVELKKTDKLVDEGKWLEAAKIWKANINNSNKSIVAKCKYNMGLVCEMEGNLDAAIEWVTDSYHVFGNKHSINSHNCMNYIRILSQRKVDEKLLDKQYGMVE